MIEKIIRVAETLRGEKEGKIVRRVFLEEMLQYAISMESQRMTIPKGSHMEKNQDLKMNQPKGKGIYNNEKKGKHR